MDRNFFFIPHNFEHKSTWHNIIGGLLDYGDEVHDMEITLAVICHNYRYLPPLSLSLSHSHRLRFQWHCVPLHATFVLSHRKAMQEREEQEEEEALGWFRKRRCMTWQAGKVDKRRRTKKDSWTGPSGLVPPLSLVSSKLLFPSSLSTLCSSSVPDKSLSGLSFMFRKQKIN